MDYDGTPLVYDFFFFFRVVKMISITHFTFVYIKKISMSIFKYKQILINFLIFIALVYIFVKIILVVFISIII